MKPREKEHWDRFQAGLADGTIVRYSESESLRRAQIKAAKKAYGRGWKALVEAAAVPEAVRPA